MKLQRAKGSTSVIETVFIQDSSSSTGAGLGSLDETSSIVGGYVRAGSTGVALAVDEDVTTEGTYQAPSSAAQVRIGTPANQRPGVYELHFHNDLFASGADSVFVSLGGATNMADLILEIQLTTVDLNDGVRGGMSALPNAAAEAAGGLYTRGTGAGQINQDANGRADANVAAVSQDATAADNLESACDNYSATRGLAGTALPDAVADGAGGVPVSIAGSLDMDALNAAAVRLTAVRAAVLTDWIDAGRLDLLLDAIKAVTDLLPNAGALSDLATILADTNELQTDDVPGLIAALNNLSTSQVNSEVADVVNTDAQAEVSGVPAANASLSAKVNWLFAVARNKGTQTSTTKTLRNDADSADIATSAVSSNGTTFTRNKWV